MLDGVVFTVVSAALNPNEAVRQSESVLTRRWDSSVVHQATVWLRVQKANKPKQAG